MKKIRLNISVIVLVTLALPYVAFSQSDFDKYIDSIRKAGMSEMASNDISMIADILAGGTSLKVTREPDGNVGRSYMSKMCFVPTKDPELLEKQNRFRETIQGREDAWIKFLQRQADTDNSGFVSTKEASILRRRIELGIIASQISSNVDELAKVMFKDRAEIISDINEYSRIFTEAQKQGLEGMPELPIGLQKVDK